MTAPSGWNWVLAGLMMLLIVVAIVFTIWAIVRGTRPSAPSPPPNDRAREILAERFARGEITTDEYQERVKHLV